MLEAFALRLAAMLFHTARQETDMLFGVPREISNLQRMFSDLSTILVYAERNHICRGNGAVGNWVSELRDAMYDMDNILDKWQIMQWGEGSSSSSMLESFKISLLFCCCNPGGTYKIGRKIQALNNRLEGIMRRSQHFDFISNVVGSSRYPDHKAVKYHRKAGSSIIRSDIVGDQVEQDTRMLVNYLFSQVDTCSKCLDNSTAVVVNIAIVGPGGIDKTTLARMIFNDSAVEEIFDRRIWLSVNQDVDETDVLQRVLSALDGNFEYKGHVGDREQLECAVKHVVRHKKFLLVMDDAWSDSIWNELLRVPLNDGAPGSQVLVTTRNGGVARRMKAQLFHHIDKLNPEDCWSLLKKVVFNDGDKSEIAGLEDIVRRCDGLPLAVKVVGGLLLSKSRTRGAWMDILGHSAWSLMSDNLNNAVFLSYEELSASLKQCFLQCSLIPKGKVIRRRTIVQMWIAEGFVRDDTDVAELPEPVCYLRHLRYFGLEGTGITTIPRGIGNLKFLPHMTLSRCENLMQLPDSIVKLQHLMSLDIRGTKISSIVRGFRNLQNLVQLWGFPTNLHNNINGRCSLGELGSLSKLKDLAIEGLEKAFAGSMVAEAKLSSKSHLISLELRCGNTFRDKSEVENDRKEYHTQIEEVFADPCPPHCIEEIVLTGYFGHQVPKWMARMAAFQNLRLLVIRDYPCCKQLPSGLGQIPFLDYFWIRHVYRRSHLRMG
ncbi:unnamed protein product [Urochloa decumbens]|uniref:Uncharacterized protein n=1 Tax=Urochloa decumbens TaxID=240449 RepID=A0ABC8YK46_9POAL